MRFPTRCTPDHSVPPAAWWGRTGRLDFDLLRWSEALSGIARTGLGFTQSLYEQERSRRC